MLCHVVMSRFAMNNFVGVIVYMYLVSVWPHGGSELCSRWLLDAPMVLPIENQGVRNIHNTIFAGARIESAPRLECWIFLTLPTKKQERARHLFYAFLHWRCLHARCQEVCTSERNGTTSAAVSQEAHKSAAKTNSLNHTRQRLH